MAGRDGREQRRHGAGLIRRRRRGAVHVHRLRQLGLLRRASSRRRGRERGRVRRRAGGSRYFDLADTSGNAQVFSGFDGSLLHTFSISVQGDFVTGGIAGIGDVDGDGHDDLAVGAQYDDTAAINAGVVRVYSGASGSALFSVYGSSVGDRLGVSVAATGDLNADGIPDLVAGMDGWGSTNGMGAALVLSGLDGSLLAQHVGDAQDTKFGRTLAGVGDVNGDGTPDLAVGASGHASSAGRVRVHSGLDGALLHQLDGPFAAAQLGISISYGGDFDPDGFADILVGTAADIGSYVGNGTARIYSGADGTLLDTIYSGVPSDGFGAAVAMLGDVNGDGANDYGGGAPNGSINGASSGSVSVYSFVGFITRYCTSVPNSTGSPALMGWAGVGSLLADDLVLSVSQLPSSSVGLFILGQTQVQLPLGDGFRCVGGAARTPPVLSASAAGTVISPLDTGNFPYSNSFHVGETWNFQFWYRDIPAGGAGFNLSDAVSVFSLP